MKSDTVKPAPPESIKIEPALLNIEQTCQLINVKRAHFYNLRASGKFAPLPVNLSRKVLYVRSEIESWIKSGCVPRKQWQILKKEFQK